MQDSLSDGGPQGNDFTPCLVPEWPSRTLPLVLSHSLCVRVCVGVCPKSTWKLVSLVWRVWVVEPEGGGCKSLSGSTLRWVFGERLESWLTGAQIDEVIVMDGGNKGLDVLSVASDEAGMNHPSGAAEHDATPIPRAPPPFHLAPSLRPLLSLRLLTYRGDEEIAA